MKKLIVLFLTLLLGVFNVYGITENKECPVLNYSTLMTIDKTEKLNLACQDLLNNNLVKNNKVNESFLKEMVHECDYYLNTDNNGYFRYCISRLSEVIASIDIDRAITFCQEQENKVLDRDEYFFIGNCLSSIRSNPLKKCILVPNNDKFIKVKYDCIVENALRDNDEKYCDNLNKKMRNDCLLNFTKEKKVEKLCDKLDTEVEVCTKVNYKDTCYSEVGYLNFNNNVCDNASNKEQCIREINILIEKNSTEAVLKQPKGLEYNKTSKDTIYESNNVLGIISEDRINEDKETGFFSKLFKWLKK